MISFGDSQYYIFVVDTDTYAGSFERAMCAYMTGEVGECGVGSTKAKLFKKEVGKSPFKSSDGIDLVAHPADEHGCTRPFTFEAWREHWGTE